MDDKNWIKGEVEAIKPWTESLFSLTVRADYPPFEAGQFARVGLPDSAGAMVERPYSLVNPPGSGPLEFYFITVPEGALSPRLAALHAGEALYLTRKPSGLFTLSALPPGETLWCLATGTGIGPFLAMLATEQIWRRFAKIILLHGVREARELGYRERITALAAERGGALVYLPMVSREAHPGALSGRIPQAIADGRLERAAGAELVAASAQVMLCGNPEMLRDTTAVLEARGMKRNKKKQPGQITVESYW